MSRILPAITNATQKVRGVNSYRNTVGRSTGLLKCPPGSPRQLQCHKIEGSNADVSRYEKLILAPSFTIVKFIVTY